ncbi:NADPH:quinone oxidoreductase family protein [Sphingomonas sp. 67-41]|jgi:NADPH2:quinone reductase|uniref:NADPH:quinone oxidoreductase family protein n=1 Tax=Sphingomonas TaxID=13687 RepID=UPI000962CA79|nr:NADPH:quinone oxidoreductase family protein [Sphingomonas sp. 67-41]OJY53867.1 MAG: NADPH:quinone oxidoreductase [Sphingomonas sp. 67-41]
MRALRSHVVGGPETLTLDEIADPATVEGEVLIAVHAAALNYPDVLLIQDLYQMRPARPFSPGSEVAGVVEAVGAGVTAFKPGDRVIGLTAWGGLADKILVPQSGCIAIPGCVPFDEAAALMVTYATSHYALRDQAAIQPGETLLVLGASGGVGIAAIQLGKACGAKVIAAVSSDAKAELVRSLGADAAVIYPADLTDRAAARAFTDAIKAEGNIDVVLDPVGGPYTEPAFRALGWQGRYLVIGFTAGIPSLPLNLTLLKGARVIGVFYGDFSRREPEKRLAYLGEIAALHAAGKIRPHISQHLPLARAPEGLAALANRQATGKIIIEFQP